MTYIRWTALVIVGMLIQSCVEGEPNEPTLATISIADVSLLELNDGAIFNFEVKASAAVESDVKMNYTTRGVTAEPGLDYVETTGSITIAAGQTTATIPVEILSDNVREQDETFEVVLTDISAGTLADATALGTIKNEDTFIDKGTDGYSTPDNYFGYNQVWVDEFDGAEIDENIWTHELGNSGWGNNESQNYTADAANSYIENGNLVIKAIQTASEQYTSARMITKDKKEWTYGRVDIRAKLPEGQGIWPAIWMLGANIDDQDWPACGEIDIMELVGHEPNTVHGTAHWGNVGSPSVFRGQSTTDPNGYQDNYHVFSILWSTSKVQWLVDEAVVKTIDPNTTAGYNYPFNQPFFMILNVAVGGNWPGYPDDTTQFPQKMTIDYVRVFQPK